MRSGYNGLHESRRKRLPGEDALIQDIGAHSYSNVFLTAPAEPGDHMLAYRGREVLLWEREGTCKLPSVGELGVAVGDLTFLFSIDGEGYYLAPDGLAEAGGYVFHPLQECLYLAPRYLAFAAVTGSQLHDWYANNRYCGRCGHPMELAPKSREIACPNCANVVYPKIMPAVICGVTWGSKILLTKYAGRAYTRYALVAGFNEVGETLEQTCAREVMEEVGLHIKNLRYYADQPWSFTSSLLVGYFCELDGDPTIHVDHKELKLGVWMEREDIPRELPDTSSLTNQMIMHFRNDWEG